MPPSHSYDGFISYSHAADGLLAPRLQAGLQRFAKPWWQRRAVRMFRDESSLSANPHLWSSITDALDASDWFVLLLSPDAAASEWVNQEVSYWVEHKDTDRILPVVTAGGFGWADGDVVGDAVPQALRGAFWEEPRSVDMRWAQDEEQLDLQDPRFADAVADVASAIRGVPKDELASEEVRQHRRTVRTAWVAGLCLALLGVVATVASFVAVGQRDAAQAEALVAQAVNQLEVDPELSMLLALHAGTVSDAARTSAAQVLTQGLLDHRTVHRFPDGDRPSPMATHAVSPDGLLAVWGWESGQVALYDVHSGDEVWVLGGVGEANLVGGSFDRDGRLLYVLESGWTEEGGADVGRIFEIDVNAGEVAGTIEAGQCPIGLFGDPTSDNGLIVARGSLHSDGVSCNGADATVELMTPETGETVSVGDYAYPLGPDGGPTVTDDGRFVAIGDRFGVRVVDVGTGEVVARFDQPGGISTIDPTGRTILVGGDSVELRDVASGELLAAFPVGSPVDAVFSADGEQVLISTVDGEVQLYDTSGRPITSFRGHRAMVSRASIANGIAVSEAADGIRAWDVDGVLRRVDLELPPALVDTGHPGGLDVAGGHILLPYHPTAGGHRYAIFDLEGRAIRASDPIGVAALSPDGSFVVQERWEQGLVQSRSDGLEVVDTASGESLVALDSCPYAVSNATREVTPDQACGDWILLTDVSISHDGSTVAAVGAWWNAAVWDRGTGERLWTDRVEAPFTWGHQIGISPDGSEVTVLDLVGAGYRAIDVTSGAKTEPIGGTNGGAEILYHPEEPVAFAAEGPGTIRVLDTDDWNVRSQYERPGGGFTDIVLSPDGDTLTAVSDDGALLSWDWRADRVVRQAELDGVLYHVAHLGSDLLVVDDAGRAMLVPTDWETLRNDALDRLTRGFTPTECATYGIDPCADIPDLRDD